MLQEGSNKRLSAKDHFRRLAGKEIDREKHPNWLRISLAREFLRDVDRCEKRGWDIQLLFDAVKLIRSRKLVPEEYNEHPLRGKKEDCLECHIGPDWVLVYKVKEKNLILEALQTGTHRECGVGDSLEF